MTWSEARNENLYWDIWVAGAPAILKNDVTWHKNEAVKQ